MLDLLTEAGVVEIQRRGAPAVTAGGAYVNNVRVEDADQAVSPAQLIGGRFVVLRTGKKQYHLVRVMA